MIDHVANMRALLNHTDPTVAARGRAMVTASRDPAVRALLKKSAAGVVSAVHGSPRTDRGAKAGSKAGSSVPAVEGKHARSASASKPGSRWAHFAGLTFAAPIAAAASSAPPPPHNVSMSGGMRVAAMRAEIIANGGRVPGAKKPEDVAAFVAAATAKARGQKATAPAKPSAPVEHDMTTPEGVAAFVLASAAKARGERR